MNTDGKRIMLGHGSGGGLMHQLIRDVFFKIFDNPLLNSAGDAAVLPRRANMMAFTTDSFVVDPVFFPGGDIGKLAVCGTINDLVAAGANPFCLSAGFIIEEGFLVKDLETIVRSMATEAKNAGVFVAAGDTKVVERGKCDQLFINTSGIGYLADERTTWQQANPICPGDHIIITGSVGDHGMAVMAARNQPDNTIGFQSDCAPLSILFNELQEKAAGIKYMNDPTRGGLASSLCELTAKKKFGAAINEEAIPVKPNVKGLCDMLGFDPLYVANEGKMLIIAAYDKGHQLVGQLKQHPLGREACRIGTITRENPGMVLMRTKIGGTRIVNMLSGEQLPRIC